MKFSFPHKKSNTQGTALKRGSALLIVLGFLSFMMVSAVSFAIYMRIERQASSNYRHAVTARHLLNASLYRAIDEIDSELRIQQLNGSDQPVKFPEWPGRTKPSAVPNGLDNGQEARVLSLEALSFIPGIFVNDVRRYAVTNQYDTVGGLTPKHRSYLGTKWRTLSMPVSSFGKVSENLAPNAYEEAVVGRYAYLCVNISDLLDVNRCNACVRTGTNHVSLAHLFYGDNPPADWAKSDRENFDDYVKNTGIRFETLQDFYACMYARNDPTFGSPYYEYLSALQNQDGDDVFDTANNQIFVSDSLAKPQPGKINSLNIAENAYKQNVRVAAQAFAEKLAAIPSLSTGDLAGDKAHFYYMIRDYIDEDSDAKWESGLVVGPLFRPSVEMTPMISQIVGPAQLAPSVEKIAVGPNVDKYMLRLTPAQPINVAFNCLFPFKYWDARRTKDPTAFSFTLDAKAYLVLVPIPAAGQDLKTQNNDLKALSGPLCFELPIIGNPTDPMPASEGNFLQLSMARFTVPNCLVDLYTKDTSSGTVTWSPPFTGPTDVRIALVVFGGIQHNGNFVDMVPGFWFPGASAPPSLTAAVAMQNGIWDRLFYQSPSFKIQDPMVAPTPLPFEWSSLEVPDPRFNHKASNWVVGTDPVKTTIADLLASQLVGKDGRDGDIFMNVSNAGRLFSPGEFGFMVRPVPNASTPPVDTTLKTINNVSQTEDYAHMFRTVRLYDHTQSHLSDDVYDYFVAQNPDGSSIGPCVTPLSESPVVLASAVEQTPVDFWFASQDPNADRNIMMDNTFNTLLGKTDWLKFRSVWMDRLTNCVKKTTINTEPGYLIRNTWQHGLSEYYGDYDKFGWYSEGKPDEIFSSGTPASLSKPLHEIDRKMLYAFSQDSFSDRQQLFLYILRAEVTVPSFGSSQESDTKSLAGGRAVALVWRDPYPVGYNPAGNRPGTWSHNNWFKTPRRISPWYQVNLNKYDESKEAYEDDVTRYDSYHDCRILYFKQLSD